MEQQGGLVIVEAVFLERVVSDGLPPIGASDEAERLAADGWPVWGQWHCLALVSLACEPVPRVLADGIEG